MSTQRRRILIGLDSSPGSLRYLDEAAEMAARLDAELVGLFVEDDNLLQLARIPSSFEVALQSAKPRNLDPDAIGRLFKQMAERAKKAVSRAAERQSVRSTFQIARGSVVGQLLRALSDDEGRQETRPWAQKLGPGGSLPSILVLHGDACVFPPGKAVILMDDDYLGSSSLPVALDLADESYTEELLFVVVSESLTAARRQIGKVTEFLDRQGRNAQVKVLSSFDFDHFLALLKNEGCGTLIFNACQNLPDRDTLNHLVEEIDYPIFLVGR